MINEWQGNRVQKRQIFNLEVSKLVWTIVLKAVFVRFFTVHKRFTTFAIISPVNQVYLENFFFL